MPGTDPIQLLFGGLTKLAPGGDDHTRLVLGRLGRRDWKTVVDVGCGSGRQTLALARELDATIHALDTHTPFLDELNAKARAAGLAERVETHALDMEKLAEHFPTIDLLWSEGAAYSIGFPHALHTWAPTLGPDSRAVVSELTWLTTERPRRAFEFFASEYPAMQTVEANVRAARAAGLEVVETYTLPPETWTEGFYDELRPRAHELARHDDEAVRALAQGMLEEIEAFETSNGSYGYVFFVLRPARSSARGYDPGRGAT